VSTELNTMMREHAVAGLQAQLDAAVTNGDTAAARKISDDLAKLAVSTAPKAPPFGDAEIRAELNKLEWFGVDPKKSGRAIALGKDMDPKKFPSAKAFADALIKAVDDELKPPVKTAAEGEEGDGEDEEGDGEDEDAKAAAAAKKPRKTDGPGEGDAGVRAASNRRTGPWTKLADAPADIQKEIKRSADKFVPAGATKEQRESFVSKALESHYAAHVRAKGKK
jgi:hypothetical protein